MPPAIAGTVALEMQFAGTAGAWTDVWDDVRLAAPLRAQYGIQGGGPLDRVADVGMLTFTLDNSALNSAGSAGYYSPGHASARSGFDIGIGCRLKISYGGTAYYKFRGTLAEVDPEFGAYGTRLSYCTVLDWMEDASQNQVRLLATQTNKRADQLIGTVVAAMTQQPAATSYGTGVDTFPYAFDNSRDEAFVPRTELERIARSELGFIFVKGDTTQGGTLTFQERHARPKAGAALTTLADNMVKLKVARQRAKIYNRVKVTTHPRRVDAAATTVLFTLLSTPLVAAGQSLTLQGQYTDPTLRAARVGGIELVTPLTATTDYTANSASDGSGTNLTASFSVSTTAGGNSAEFVVTNSSGTDGYLTKLQIRGKGLYDYGALVSDKGQAGRTYDNILAVDMPLQTSVLVGDDAANYLLTGWGTAQTLVEGVGFVANSSDALMTAGLAREPGDRITLSEAQTGLSDDFYINGISLRLGKGGIMAYDWVLAPADPFTAWILGVTGASELGVTTYLGY